MILITNIELLPYNEIVFKQHIKCKTCLIRISCESSCFSWPATIKTTNNPEIIKFFLDNKNGLLDFDELTLSTKFGGLLI